MLYINRKIIQIIFYVEVYYSCFRDLKTKGLTKDFMQWDFVIECFVNAQSEILFEILICKSLLKNFSIVNCF